MHARLIALALLPLAAWCGDWNAAGAAKYLDGRAAEWAVWKRAAREGGPCVSCHTTLGYLIVRPALRRDLHESAPTEFETGLIAGVRTRTAKPAGAVRADNTQAVLAALVLAMDDARGGKGLSKETEAAFRTMWATQRPDGAWGWTDARLEPWEVKQSEYLGAALAMAATGIAPDGYRNRKEIKLNVIRLKDYVQEHTAGQPLASRLVLLWGAVRLNGPGRNQQPVADEAWKKQNPDGGWSLASLGPWNQREDAPPQPEGSSALATAWTAGMLKLAGVGTQEPAMDRALTWLRTHQQPDGSWEAVSMNKHFEAGSMEEKFMRDAATAYASLALSGR